MSFQVKEQITVLPAVPGAQNGSDKAHVLRTVYDEQGEESSAPVRYSSGQLNLSFTDLSASIFGVPWGHTRVVSNVMGNASGGMHGYGQVIRQQPYLVAHGGRLAVVSGGNRNVWFDPPQGGGNTYRPAFGGSRASLVKNPAQSELIFSTRSGEKRVFHDLVDPVPLALRGKLKALVARSGQVLTPVYSTQGALIRLSAEAGGRKVQFTYDYFGAGDGVGYAGRLRYVLLEAGPTGAPEERRRVRYDYYTGSNAHGLAGDLRAVFHEEWDGSQWFMVRCEYYRSWTSDASPGYSHGLKLVVGSAGCVALGDPATYDSFSDAQILAVSDYYFEYNGQHRVTLEKTHGGSLAYAFQYEQTTRNPLPGFTGIYSGSTLNSSLWFTRTTETLPDGNQHIVYTNRMGKVLVKTFKETATGDQWHLYNVYDSEGRYLRKFRSSAITSVAPPGTLAQSPTVTLEPGQGVVLELTYYPDNASGSGEVPGLIATEGFRQGDSGNLAITRRLRYGSHTVDGLTVNPVIEEIRYAATGESLTGALIRRFKYAYHGGGSTGSLGSQTIEEWEYPAVNRVDADTVFEQARDTFDDGGNRILHTAYQRFHDATGTGELHGPEGSSPRARRGYIGFWPDALGRERLSADYGTNSGVPLSRPGVCPSASAAKIRVSRVQYNDRGEAWRFTDPLGVVTEQTRDHARRPVQIVENVLPGITTPDANRTTNLTYLPGSLLSTMTLVNAVTGNQVTQWLYGTQKTGSQPSAVATGHLLRAKKLPGDTDSTCLRWRYNRAGEIIYQTDANGTEREIVRNRRGQILHDIAKVLGTSGGASIDGAIRRLSRSYNRQGLLSKAGSYSTVTIDPETIFPLNEVELLYNAFGQLAKDRQAHGGVADGSSPVVQYGFADGEDNHLRLTDVINPSGSVIQRQYGTSGGINDRLSRPQHLRNPADADPAVSYLYAGLAWIIEAAYPEPGVRLTQHNLGGMAIGDGGDQYVGVDRFGQLEELRWHRISSPTTWLEHLTFGYNKSGSRLWRENLLFGNTEDELYAYDGLYQITARQRGNLTNDKLAIAGTPQREEALAFDPLGNWTGYNAKALGTAFLTQTRTHNQANQITALANSVPAVTPLGVSHDAAGNIVQAPPDPAGDWTKGFKLTWDAWNRIVKVRKANDNSEVATFAYDALFRRTIRKVGGTDHHEYWDAAWHLVEERLSTSSQPHFQYLWGLNGFNDLVRRDDTTSAPGGEDSSSSGSTPSSRLYVLSDGMSPTAILDRSGTLLERQSFSAFGLLRLLAPNGSDRATSVLSDWRFAFHGQFYDTETGFANYGFRYYSPQVGRWLGRDPLGEKGGSNLYRALRNASTLYVDRLGLDIVPVDLYDESLDNDRATRSRRQGVSNRPDTYKYDKEKAKRFADKIRKTLEALKECCKKPELASFGICHYLNDKKEHPLHITPEDKIDNGTGGTQGQAPTVSLPKADDLSLDQDVLDDQGRPSGDKQSLAALLVHEFQHEFDHKHPDGSKPDDTEYDRGTANRKYKNPSEKSAVDAENAFRKFCPDVCPGDIKGSYWLPENW